MTPVKMPHTTKVLGAPKDWDDHLNGPCIGLPVTEAHGNFYSYWKLSFKERLQVLFGKKITLVVASSFHPPVAFEIEFKL